DASSRGSHVALRHPRAATLVRELESQGVLVDFREPDYIRVGLAPLYNRFVDVYDAAQAITQAAPNLPEFAPPTATTR
ncbi:MAG: hypothetical protein WB770_05505, partial [Acidimicrobiales bacterium]